MNHLTNREWAIANIFRLEEWVRGVKFDVPKLWTVTVERLDIFGLLSPHRTLLLHLQSRFCFPPVVPNLQLTNCLSVLFVLQRS